MTQKLLKVGSSAAVTIPKKSLKELGLKIGDEVYVGIDRVKKVVSISSAGKLSGADAKIAKLTFNFINRYRKDLEALGRK
ncbi:MAG: hypothetical protein A3C11_00375 [Candidatus Sungbacteria bacterium RIFCSPHIGHO2_02_FULL_49_12]|uniref:SpoVT-AbrB domain-containing protein n=2 Tax=Parcubacteria group TaxID=1794811 RepID=A0A1G2CG17_9BACT|nr:MAG: hypothetical protein A2945_00755 [Candidatus Liptonbacteria bacterium RIFCSPLOWO2_01_FULL_52_25]OHA01264.1 MAG: hypothetical protein A3C11_00375 [Candidatus Sungbacteria bacterium RIFCSPHIGHO2_02_FULL_49_12]